MLMLGDFFFVFVGTLSGFLFVLYHESEVEKKANETFKKKTTKNETES